MPKLRDKLEQFLSVILKPSNSPRLMTLYVSFYCASLMSRCWENHQSTDVQMDLSVLF